MPYYFKDIGIDYVQKDNIELLLNYVKIAISIQSRSVGSANCDA